LIDATQIREKDLREYDAVGFASGIYYSKFHQSVLNFASVNLPQDKKVFYICTNGGNASYKSIEDITKRKNAIEIGRFSCKGYDTFGPFKLVGGLAKGHPDDSDLKNAVEFFKGLE
jgi:flavodoxin